MQRYYLVVLATLFVLSACDREQASNSTAENSPNPAVTTTGAVEKNCQRNRPD